MMSSSKEIFELDDGKVYVNILKKYGLKVVLKALQTKTAELVDISYVKFEEVIRENVKTTQLEYLMPDTSLLGFKLPWANWGKGQGIGTFDRFYYFKQEKGLYICVDAYPLQRCLFQEIDPEIEKRRPFSFSLRHANRPRGDKLVLAAADEFMVEEWREYFSLSVEEFRKKMFEFLSIKAGLIQKMYRGHRQRSKFIDLVEKLIRLQAVFRGVGIRRHYKKQLRAIIKIQSFGRMVIAKRLLLRLKIAANISKYQAHRKNVVKEILSTEETYVKDLENVMRFYYNPLKALFPETELASPLTKKPASPTSLVTFFDISSIFSNLPEICEKHQPFLAKLRVVADNYDEKALIGPLFIEMSQWLDIYVKFCNNYDETSAIIERCKKNEIFNKVLVSFSDSKDLKKLNLQGYLITPVQRLPRYELLLKDLLKHTWLEHPDKQNLQIALDSIRKSIIKVNESKRQDSTKKKLAKFHEKFKQPSELESVLGQGNFVAEGAGKVIEDGKFSKAYFVLFEDQLVIAKRTTDRVKETKMHYRKTYRFSGAKSYPLEMITNPVEAIAEPQGEKDKEVEYEFDFVFEGKTIRALVKDMITRNKWVKDINTAREKLIKAFQ